MKTSAMAEVFLFLGGCVILSPLSTFANPLGDGGLDLWVDGPAAVQPGIDRDFPDAAVDPDGNTVFVWGTGEIYLRRFDPRGSALEDPVQVNSTVDFVQSNPRIAMHDDGSFLVVWQSREPEPIFNGSASQWIRTQAFDADAQPVGSEQLLYPTSAGSVTDRHADVAALPGGSYVVVWAQNLEVAPDTGRSIQARLVGADGLPVGDAFVVNSTIGESEVDPTVTELDDGGFLIAWDLFPNLAGRRFDAAGQAVTEDFQLTVPVVSNRKKDPDLARGADGRILLVWEEGEGISGVETRGRMFSAALDPLGDDFRINTLTEGGQSHARAAPLGESGFLVVWESPVSGGDDTDASIQGRVVTGNNEFGGPQFQINRYTPGGQYDPATGARGGVVSIVWGSARNEFSGNDDVITGQTYSECGIFCDSFE